MHCRARASGSASLLLVLAIGALASCRTAASSHGGLAGAYSLDRNATVRITANAYVVESEQVRQQFRKGGGVSIGPVGVPLGMDPIAYATWSLAGMDARLELKPDGSFVRTSAQSGRATVEVGTWAIEREELSLHTEELGVLQSVRAAVLPGERVRVGGLVYVRR